MVSGYKAHVERRFRLTLDVSRVWKGPVESRFILYAREDSGGDCGGFFTEPGMDVLVFGVNTPADDVFLDGIQVNGEPDHRLWFTWLDVLPKGQLITLPIACSLSAEAQSPYAKKVMKKLGRGRPPTPSQ